VGRTWHGGLLFQSKDYGQVAAMRFSLLPTATVTDGVMAHRFANGTPHPREVRCALRRRPLRKGGDSES
jgi:hypothetical protein